MKFLKYLTPINLKEEKQKFFANKKYNPKLKYIWEENSKKTNFHNLYKRSLTDAIVDQDIDKINETAPKYFETNLDEYEDKAKDIVKRFLKNPIENYATPEQAKNEFEKALEYFEIVDMKVKIVAQRGFNFRPDVLNNRIVISKYSNQQFFPAPASARHEICHIIRALNSQYNNIFKATNYISTEEGLATHIHDKFDKTKASEFQHATEYIASRVSLQGTFVDVFEYFVDLGFNEQLAWNRAIRHKFGFKDTSKPGDIIKPAMYYYNAQKVAGLTQDEKLRLFVGKIHISELKKYPEYFGRFSRKKVVQYFEI